MFAFFHRWSWLRKAVALAIVATVVVVGYSLGRRWHRDSLAAVELRALRDRGLPTNAVELNEYVALKPGEADATAAWMTPFTSWRSVNTSRPSFSNLLGSLHDYLSSAPGGTWSSLTDAKAFVSTNQSLYDRIDVALATPGKCVYVSDYRPSGIALSHLDGSRVVCKLLALRAFAQAYGDRADGTVNDLRGMVAIAETMKDEPLIISQSVRRHILHHSLIYLERLLPPLAGGDPALARMQNELAGVDLLAGMRASVIGYRAQQLETLRTSWNDRLRGAWHGDDALSILQAVAKVEQVLDEDWPAPLKLAEEYPQELDFRTIGSRSPWGANDIAPSFGSAMIASQTEWVAEVTARLRAAETAIATVRYHADHDSWPESLQQLVPEYLAEVPTDPFTGGSMKMSNTETELRIYSVGANRADDGGEEAVGLARYDERGPTGSPDVVFRVPLDGILEPSTEP